MRAFTVQSTSSQPISLSTPVGSLMRPTNSVAPEDSLERAASELRRNGSGLLPIVSNGLLMGVVTERSLALAMVDAISHLDPAERGTVPAETIAPYATAAEALRRYAEGDGGPLVVVDDAGRPMGLLSASDLYPRRRSLPRPALVGGMATPFGVYLTNGAVSGGAGGFGLFCTGALLAGLFLVSHLPLDPLYDFLVKYGWRGSVADAVLSTLGIGLFLLLMRLIPLSGTHGAEHMVVHAIERGEELTPDIVRRMPRVHPRCGTNLAAGATLFMGISGAAWIPWPEVRDLVAILATLMLWRPLGSLLQQYVTTRPPSEKQIQSAIRAANELMERYSQSRVAVPSIPQRLLRSGLMHVLLGSTTISFVFYGLSELFGWGFKFQ